MRERRVFEPDAASEAFEDAILSARGRIRRYEQRRRALRRGLCAAACLVAVFAVGVLAGPKLRRTPDRVALSAPPQTTQARPSPAATARPVEAGDIAVVVRYKTVVVRIPENWIAAHAPEASEEAGETVALSGEAAARAMCDLMDRRTADALTLAANSLGTAGSRFCRAGVTEIDNENKALCTRRIGSDWYAVIRLEESLGERVDFTVELEDVALQITPERLTLETGASFSARLREVPVRNRDSQRAALRKTYGDVSLALYETDDMNIAVITEKGGAVYAAEDAGLDIGGLCAEVRCYADGEDGVYCCAFSEEECAAIRAGEELKIRH